jgi:hypothetical protein
MTYQDPDPLRNRDTDPRLNANRDPRETGASNAMWGWIAGIAVLVLMLVFLFGSNSQNTQTSDNANRPAITTPPNNSAMSPRPTMPAPTPPETTGQGSSQQ